MTKLALYKKKRNFNETSEPEAAVEKKAEFRFVIQEHHARNLHYDFRLQLEGVLKSWAVPKGPPQEPGEKRLAVQVEDHPVSYINFKGTIPKGNYGAGTVAIFDKGTFIPVDENETPITEKQALKNLKAGEIKVVMKGKIIKGGYVLVRFKKDDKNWLLIKHKEKAGKKKVADAAKKIPAEITINRSLRTNKNEKVTDAVKPMLAEVANKAFDKAGWIYEIKWDGYRAIASIKDTIQLYSRNGILLNKLYPEILQALKKLKHSCILDGEVVWLNEDGKADFQQLQHYDPLQPGKLVYQAFDLLELDGKNTCGLPLLQRKILLKKLLGKNNPLMFSKHIAENGIEFFNEVKKLGLEGIMAKDGSSTYHAGIRTKAWLKVKNMLTEDCYVMGYTAPKGNRTGFGSLILGRKIKNEWIFNGHVGTGFNTASLKEIYGLLQPLVTTENPFHKKVPVNDRPTWVKPVMIVEISYTEQTRDGIFRHPSFLRLRDDKMKPLPTDIKTVKVKRPAAKTRGIDKTAFTNTGKIFWPKEGYTKGDVINYYQSMASYILPHLKDRPLSLKRNPNGINDPGFYHKDAGEQAPEFVKVFPYDNEEKIIDYIICNNEATLLYLANLGCIEMNPWNNRYNKTDKPDWLAIDIDPGDANTFKQVIQVAKAAKKIIDKAGLTAYCKTSGASGIHIFIPLNGQYDYEIVKNFGAFFMQKVEQMLPDITTLQRTKAKRGKKIYLDFLQNRRGQTLASVYSIRPVPGATVSAPIKWSELKESLSPSFFTIENMAGRVKKLGDLFKPVLTEKNNLRKALALLNE